MKLRKLSVAGLVSALLVGSLGLGAASATADDGVGTITGQVTRNGKPVNGARVTLTSEDDYSWGGGATTDASGRYTITATPGTGVVWVETSSSKFLATYSGNTVRFPDAKKVSVTAGGSQTVDVKVTASATITGKVVDAKGKPVKGVHVWGENVQRSGRGHARTNAQGRYVLRGLATGPVEVIASKGTGQKYRDGAAPRVIAVQGKSVTAKTIRIKAEKKGTLKATIKGVQKGDAIWAYDTRAKYPLELDTADKKGKLKITGKVPVGTYRVVIGGTNKASKAVTVKANKSVNAGTLKAPKKRARLTGVVKGSNGKRVGGVNVTAYDSYGTYAGNVTASTKGRYTITGLASGKYVLHVYDDSLKNARTSKGVKVAAKKKTKKNIKLAKAYRVTGTITHRGKPVVGVDVYSDWSSAVTDSSGRYTLRGIGKGKVRLLAHDPYAGGYRYASKNLKVKKNTTWSPKLKK